MPFEIDAFKGSPAVQAMHPVARIGYWYLLSDAWQTDDCTIPTDPIDLADKSGLGDELWAIHGPRILRKFDPVEGSDRLRNTAEYDRWLDAKRIYDLRHIAADRTNKLRSPSRSPLQSPSADRDASVTLTLARATETETETGTNTKAKEQKPSAKAKPPQVVDDRNSFFMQDFRKAFLHINHIEAPWDGKEAGSLARWLKKNPTITREQWQAILRNRRDSPVGQKTELSRWIGLALSWLDGLADEWGKPTGGNGHVGNTKKPTIVEAQLAELQRFTDKRNGNGRQNSGSCVPVGDDDRENTAGGGAGRVDPKPGLLLAGEADWGL